MRRINKGEQPQILLENRDDWARQFRENPSEHNRHRYRNPQIKESLMAETYEKCVYCESKVGHNTPGDVEHKLPTSVFPEKHFDWDNLTITCNECNRRKGDFYNEAQPFLDPYVDDVEEMLMHIGPVIVGIPGNARAEIAVRILELGNRRRKNLILKKVELIENLNNLVQRITTETGLIRALLIEELYKRADLDQEYSGMVHAFIQQLEIRGVVN